MILDGALAAVVILSMVFGFRRGFVYTFAHTLGWLGAIIASFFLAPKTKILLKENTAVDTSIYDSLFKRFDLSGESVTRSTESLPRLIGESVNSAAKGVADGLATGLTELFLLLLGFIAALFLIKLVLFLLMRIFSKKRTRGFVGFFDGLLGLIAGALRGVLLAFLLLALLLPAVHALSPSHMATVMDALDASYLARSLYDSNFILLILQDFFG